MSAGGPFPPPERRADHVSRARLDEVTAEFAALAEQKRAAIAAMNRTTRVWKRVALLLTAALVVVAVVVSLALVRIGSVTDEVAQQAHRIDRERWQNTLTSCRATNDRNRAANKAARVIPEGEGRALTTALIEALAPERPDCEAYATEQAPEGAPAKRGPKGRRR